MVKDTDKRTSEEWQKVYSHIIVLDPDGWDRKNYQYSWFEEEITEEEFVNRVMTSTCKRKILKV